MKKLVLFVAVVAAASFASCKKDRTCTCDWTSTQTQVTTISGGGTTTDVTTDSGTNEVVYTKAKKGDARAACLSYTTTDENSYSGSGYTVTTTTDYEATCSLSK